MELGNFGINTVPEEDMKAIDTYLDLALEAGLEIEVIYFALIAMKKNPELTPSEALAVGITEWIR